MERVLNTSFRHKWAQGVSFLIPQRLGRIKYLNHFQVRVQTQITMERVLYIARQNAGSEIFHTSTKQLGRMKYHN